MTAEVLEITIKEDIRICKQINESAELSCCHTVPYKTNTTSMYHGSLTLHAILVNGTKITLLPDTRSTLGISWEYMNQQIYTDEHISCKMFVGNEDHYKLA